MIKAPTKLKKALALLSEEERDVQMKRFHDLHAKAIEHGFQSPVFWASRMVLSDRNDVEIGRLIAKRLKKEST